jgi:hypothetical protein
MQPLETTHAAVAPSERCDAAIGAMRCSHCAQVSRCSQGVRSPDELARGGSAASPPFARIDDHRICSAAGTCGGAPTPHARPPAPAPPRGARNHARRSSRASSDGPRGGSKRNLWEQNQFCAQSFSAGGRRGRAPQPGPAAARPPSSCSAARSAPAPPRQPRPPRAPAPPPALTSARFDQRRIGRPRRPAARGALRRGAGGAGPARRAR